jgi:dephospho-CoA kinase
MSKVILGLAAELAGGKGTVAKYVVEKYTGSSHRFSTMLRDILKRIYLPDTRENMQNLSTILRQQFGEDTLAKVMAEDVKNDAHEVVAVDGVRRPADILYLKEIPGFKLVYIETSIENRFERIKKRGENPDDTTKTLEQFKKDQEGEADAQIKNLKSQADYVVDNDGSYEDLYTQIDKTISEVKSNSPC